MKRINRTYMINPEIHNKLKVYAAKKNIPFSHLVEYLITEFLRNPRPINLFLTEQFMKEIPE